LGNAIETKAGAACTTPRGLASSVKLQQLQANPFADIQLCNCGRESTAAYSSKMGCDT
jgi:hypothetical protein